MRSLPSFFKIMKLLFENIYKDYEGFDSFTPALVGSSWVGLAEVEKKLGDKLVKVAGVSELNESDWDWYKKKATGEPIAYRQFNTVKQEPERNPNADYVEEVKEKPGKSASSDNPKDLIEVDVVEVEKPLEDEAPTPKKTKKGSK